MITSTIKTWKNSIVYLVRHGRIPDYMTDRPLTGEGREEAYSAGEDMASDIGPDECVRFFSSPARRARETAGVLRDGLLDALAKTRSSAVVEEIISVNDALQNFQIIFDGISYDPIYPLHEVANWRLHNGQSPLYRKIAEYQRGFWESKDPMAYWLTYESVAVEPPESVEKRVRAFIEERFSEDAPLDKRRSNICVTHSANLRAFLRSVFGGDPGEPPFCGHTSISVGKVLYQGRLNNF